MVLGVNICVISSLILGGIISTACFSLTRKVSQLSQKESSLRALILLSKRKLLLQLLLLLQELSTLASLLLILFTLALLTGGFWCILLLTKAPLGGRSGAGRLAARTGGVSSARRGVILLSVAAGGSSVIFLTDVIPSSPLSKGTFEGEGLDEVLERGEEEREDTRDVTTDANGSADDFDFVVEVKGKGEESLEGSR